MINDGMINMTPEQFEKLSSGHTIICELLNDSPVIETGDITSVWCEGKSLPVKILHKFHRNNPGMLCGCDEVACVVLQEYKSDEVKLAFEPTNQRFPYDLPLDFKAKYNELEDIINEFSKISIHEMHLNFPNGEVIINKGK